MQRFEREIKGFIKRWMLPIAMAGGILACLLISFTPALKPVEPPFTSLAKNIQPVLVAVMLFLQFVKISPHDLHIRPWHFALLGVQVGFFAVFALLSARLGAGSGKILCECAMLCFICPTAAAAGVITDRLGGSLADTISYVALINIVAAVLIPLAVPIVRPEADVAFMASFLRICGKIFPLLVLPLLLAWFIRYCVRKLQRFLMRYTHWAFYFWGISLAFATYLATDALLGSGISLVTALLIALVSMLSCTLQFLFGKAIGRRFDKRTALSSNSDSTIVPATLSPHSDSSVVPADPSSNAGSSVVPADPSLNSDSTEAAQPPTGFPSTQTTAGQTLGQKNTGFLIWLGYNFFTPVTSVAGGLYSIWQNLINTWELRHHERTPH